MSRNLGIGLTLVALLFSAACDSGPKDKILTPEERATIKPPVFQKPGGGGPAPSGDGGAPAQKRPVE